MDFARYWKDIVHYGTSLPMIVIGGFYALGGSIPGVHVDNPKTLFTAGLGVLAAGLKAGWKS